MQTQATPVITRQERNQAIRKKRNRRMTFRYIVVLFVLLVAGCTGFLYGTSDGHQMRLMLAGSILSSQHPQYARFLLSEAELNKLKSVIAEPPNIRSTIGANGMATAKKQGGELVRVETVDTPNYTAKVMLVSDPTRVHLVETQYANKGEPLSKLIEENGAVAGINAGGFEDPNGNGSGGQPLGIVISNGQVLCTPDHNRNERQLVGGFTKSGEFLTGSYSVNELQRLGVTEAVSFGPQLLVDGRNVVSSSINAAYGWAPRTVIGQAADGTVVMIITDGRFFDNKSHRGASMQDMASLLSRYGVQNAIALDGGGSTTMINQGQLQLKPATFTDVGMRYLPNAFVVVP